MHQLINQRLDQRVQRKDFPGIHLDVSRENLSFEFFDLPFDHVHWCTLDVKENRDTWLMYPCRFL